MLTEIRTPSSTTTVGISLSYPHMLGFASNTDATCLNYIHKCIIHDMKPVQFLGDSLKCLREFPKDVRQDAGWQLDRVQRGKQPDDFTPMPSIGKGVEEIRVWDDSGTYRVIYTARIANAIFVLAAL